ncbi:MAG: hypothetical protein O7F17_11560 [Planctomycetota bacterium]|nr:hypothetical protein [Planctomycetota bacterium]
MLSRRVLHHWKCEKCGYDLRGSFGRSARCPECGSPIPTTPPPVVSTVRYQRPLLIVGGILLGIPVLCNLAYVALLIYAFFAMVS